MTNTKGLLTDVSPNRALSLNVAASTTTAIPTAAKIRILIADDQTIPRCALHKLLETQSDFDIVGEVTAGPEAVQSTYELLPDVLLLVLSSYGLSGLDVVSQLTERGSTVRTILLTASIDTSDTVRALHLGARGVILNDSPMHLLFKSVRCVFRGELWLGRDAMSDVVQALSFLSSHRMQSPADGLTTREREVLTLVVSGYTNKDIARTLSICHDTVKRHLTNIFDKTGVSNRLELALFAIHHHVVAGP